MSTVRWMLVNRLRADGNVVTSTYGYITKNNRISLGLAKSHINDAYVIAGGTVQERTSTSYSIQQVRKCNRKLFKGDRSHIKIGWNESSCICKGKRTGSVGKCRYIVDRMNSGISRLKSGRGLDLPCK